MDGTGMNSRDCDMTAARYGRKIHYTGDLIMALSWGLISGFKSYLPYFYVTFFVVVLVHRYTSQFQKLNHSRVSRDMERCARYEFPFHSSPAKENMERIGRSTARQYLTFLCPSCFD